MSDEKENMLERVANTSRCTGASPSHVITRLGNEDFQHASALAFHDPAKHRTRWVPAPKRQLPDGVRDQGEPSTLAELVWFHVGDLARFDPPW